MLPYANDLVIPVDTPNPAIEESGNLQYGVGQFFEIDSDTLWAKAIRKKERCIESGLSLDDERAFGRVRKSRQQSVEYVRALETMLIAYTIKR